MFMASGNCHVFTYYLERAYEVPARPCLYIVMHIISSADLCSVICDSQFNKFTNGSHKVSVELHGWGLLLGLFTHQSIHTTFMWLSNIGHTAVVGRWQGCKLWLGVWSYKVSVCITGTHIYISSYGQSLSFFTSENLGRNYSKPTLIALHLNIERINLTGN